MASVGTKAARKYISALLKAKMPEWHHYAVPPAQASGKSVFVTSRDDYVTPNTVRVDDVRLRVHLFVPLPAGAGRDEVMDVLDDGMDTARDALMHDTTRPSIDRISGAEGVDWGSTPCVALYLDITVLHDPRAPTEEP